MNGLQTWKYFWLLAVSSLLHSGRLLGAVCFQVMLRDPGLVKDHLSLLVAVGRWCALLLAGLLCLVGLTTTSEECFANDVSNTDSNGTENGVQEKTINLGIKLHCIHKHYITRNLQLRIHPGSFGINNGDNAVVTSKTKQLLLYTRDTIFWLEHQVAESTIKNPYRTNNIDKDGQSMFTGSKFRVEQVRNFDRGVSSDGQVIAKSCQLQRSCQ